MESIRKNILTTLVITLLAGLSQAANAGSNDGTSTARKPGVESSLYIEGRTTQSPAINSKLANKIKNTASQHALDIYYDWHKQWKLNRSNNIRSES